MFMDWIELPIFGSLKKLTKWYQFSADLCWVNSGLSLKNTVLPNQTLPVKNWCSTISILVAHILQSDGIDSRVCFSERERWSRLLQPIHFLNSVIDGNTVYYIDFYHWSFHLSSGEPPSIVDRDNIRAEWDYSWEDTLIDLLASHNPVLVKKLQWRRKIRALLPTNYPFLPFVKKRAIKRADRFNVSKDILYRNWSPIESE